jgi:biofilm PGA synthesis N-glycosyltransferase PgaC
LPRGYFARVLALMDADPRLGTVSGKAYFPGPSNPDGRFDGELISENIGDDVSLGMVKLWRRQCFDDIGGIVRGVLWDGIDCYRARMLGWKAYSTDEPELRFVHLRPMGASHNGIITGRQRWGSGHWFMGSSPLFVLATAVNRARYRPRVVGGMAMVWGYIKAALRRDPRLSDAEFRSYLRKYQWRMMTRGKPAAVREFDQLGEPRWRAAHASHQH